MVHTPVTLLVLLTAAGAAHAHSHNALHYRVARQDPHAIPPLEQITGNMPVEPPVPLKVRPVAGSQPPIAGAPKLPAIPPMSGYPTVKPVPTDSPEVKQWLAEVAASGVKIPDIPVNKGGDALCDNNPAAAAAGTASGSCWWSCTGCVRDTDYSTCPNKLEWGLTFDDGPSPYTPKVLDYLAEKNLKASFYVIGANVVNHPEILQATYMAGNEICLHTWTHTALTTLTNEQVVAELGWTRKVVADVLGVNSTCIRPPYGDVDDRIRAIAKAMGITPVVWTSGFDTNDWTISTGGPGTSTKLMEGYRKMLDTLPTLATGVISLQHDWYQGTVDLALGYFFPAAMSHNPPPKFMPVIQCQKQPPGSSYVETKGAGFISGGGGSGSGSGGSNSTSGSPSPTGGKSGSNGGAGAGAQAPNSTPTGTPNAAGGRTGPTPATTSPPVKASSAAKLTRETVSGALAFVAGATLFSIGF